MCRFFLSFWPSIHRYRLKKQQFKNATRGPQARLSTRTVYPRKQSFQKFPLWRAFIKSWVFKRLYFHWIRMDGRPKKKKKIFLRFQMKTVTRGQRQRIQADHQQKDYNASHNNCNALTLNISTLGSLVGSLAADRCRVGCWAMVSSFDPFSGREG